MPVNQVEKSLKDAISILPELQRVNENSGQSFPGSNESSGNSQQHKTRLDISMQKIHGGDFDGQNIWIDFREEEEIDNYPAIVTTAGDLRVQKGEHYHITDKFMKKFAEKFYILQYTQEGKGEIVYRSPDGSSENYTLVPGQCFFITPELRFDFFNPDCSYWSYIYIGFRGEFAERLFRRITEERPVRYLAPNSAVVDRFHEIFHYALHHRICHSNLKILSCTILLELEKEFFYPEHQACDPFLEQAESWTQQHLQKATVHDLAKHFNVSEKYFQKLFKQKTGKTPGEFLAEQRLQCVMRLLKCTNMKLSGIAETAGFSDASHLCRCFRQKNGITPDLYRQKMGNSDLIKY